MSRKKKEENGGKKPEWKLVFRGDLTEYKCGAKAGDVVRLRSDIVCRWMSTGKPTGEVHKAGECWRVLASSPEDPVIFLLQANGKMCTWDDNESFWEQFERIEEADQGTTPVEPPEQP